MITLIVYKVYKRSIRISDQQEFHLLENAERVLGAEGTGLLTHFLSRAAETVVPIECMCGLKETKSIGCDCVWSKRQWPYLPPSLVLEHIHGKGMLCSEPQDPILSLFKMM